MKFLKNIRLLIALILLATGLYPMAATAQNTIVRGRVTDNEGFGLPFAAITVAGTTEGTATDDDGRYQLDITNTTAQTITVSYMGFRKVVHKITQGKDQTFNVVLVPDSHELQAVTIKSKKGKYRNKRNPAVSLIEQIIANKENNVLTSFRYASYRQYEKMTFSLSNTPQKLRKNLLLRRYKYMTDNIDTLTIPGKGLLPWYMQERSSTAYYRHDLEKKKEIISGEKKVDFGEFIDNAGMNAYLKHMYQDVDIYKNNINVVTNQFLSPIANNAPVFYRYYITDTVTANSEKWVELSFYPRNKSDFLFQGKLYVTLNGRFAVAKAEMTINKDINLNWVKDLNIMLDFTKDSTGFYTLTKSTLTADFGLLKNSSGGLYGKREVSFRDHQYNQPVVDSIFSGPGLVTNVKANNQSDSFWIIARTDSLTVQEQNAYVAIDKLGKEKSFKRTMDILTMFVAGYKRAGPFVEIGPVNTFYGFNPVEGLRLRLGGRTTPRFSKKINFETFAAYGFKDESWKYYLGTTYSLTKRSIYEFPVIALKASYQHDTKIPGQDLQFVQEDNFLLSFKRGVNDRYLYNDIYKIEFLHEFENHFSYQLSFKNWKQSPTGGLHYEHDEDGSRVSIPQITTTEVGLTLRWAPHEQFFQGKLYRTPLVNKYPVFTLRASTGIKGLVNGQYDYQSLTLNIYKHIYLSQLGYSNLSLEGGVVFGKAPYPLLDIHRANQSYSMQMDSYNLMNFLEFTSDRYASFSFDHCFNGFLFNKIPLVKKAKLREHINLKMLYGSLSDKNDPRKHEELVQFPTDIAGRSITYTLDKQPYVEGSIGIGNIFKFFRVDLVKRFTYLDNPNVSELGIRGRFKLDF